MFETPRSGLAGLQLFQIAAQLLGRSNLNSRRQRVNEKSDDGFNAFDFSGTPGYGGAKDHVARSAVTVQRQRPCALDDRAQCYLLSPGKRLKPLTKLSPNARADHFTGGFLLFGILP